MSAHACGVVASAVYSYDEQTSDEASVLVTFTDGEDFEMVLDMRQDCCENARLIVDKTELVEMRGRVVVRFDIDQDADVVGDNDYAVTVTLHFADGPPVSLVACNSHNGYYAHHVVATSSYGVGHPLGVSLNTSV